MRVLVSGGAGFIGSHLCDSLLADGHDVVAVDNFITGRPINIGHLDVHPRFSLVRRDIVNGVDVKVDQIYHLASPASPVGYMRHPIETHLTNSTGTHNMLKLARRYGARLLYTSTSEAYGNPIVHPQPETYFGNVNPVGPRSCYDESKRFGESITMEYVRQFGLDARIIRIFNTYGPRTDPVDGRVIPNFISSAQRGEPLVIYGDGSQTRSLCYVSDLVRGIRLAMDAPETTGQVINLGNPDERTILDLAQLVNEFCGSSAGVRFVVARQDDPERRCPDITKARTLLGWSPAVDLEEGLRETIEFFRDVECTGA
ncbi:MAG TPA: UDP-glucuronic acid decarboxylase family protein [Thermomicrobiales bacterium]|nr:UDP-glucuronic acid decarboxylase family protein [Thermomicrobiales bacterium]